MIIQNIEIVFRKKETQENKTATDRDVLRAYVELSDGIVYPHDEPFGALFEFRSRAVQKSSLVMYKETPGGKWHFINIASVPYEAIRYFLEGIKKKSANINNYDKHVFCEYDVDPHFDENHRLDDNNANESYVLYKIAKKIADAFNTHVTLLQEYELELTDRSNKPTWKEYGISVFQKYLEQYAFYFIYNSVNYKDTWILFSPVFPNASEIDINPTNSQIPNYQDYIDENKNFISSFNGCVDYFLLKNRYLYSRNAINTASSEAFTWDFADYMIKKIKYIFRYEVSHGFLFRQYQIPFSLYPNYNGVTRIEKDIWFIGSQDENTMFSQGRPTDVSFAKNIMRYIYRYLDSSANDEKKALGVGFVVCEQKLKDDNENYVSNMFTNFGGALHYVPFLSGLLKYLAAIQNGYKPFLYIVDRNPTENNLVATRIIKEQPVNTTFKDFLQINYYKRLYIKIENGSISLYDNQVLLADKMFYIHELIEFLESRGYDCFYLAPFSTEEFYEKAVLNSRINIMFEYFTLKEALPAFLSTDVEDIKKQWTGEPSFIGRSIGTNIDYRYISSKFPCAIFYNPLIFMRPFTYKRMRVLEAEAVLDQNTSQWSYNFILPDYKYDELKDFLTSPPYQVNPLNFFEQNATMPIDYQGGNIHPPVFNVQHIQYPDVINAIKSFSFLTTGRIMLYPSVFNVSPPPTSLTADSFDPDTGLYYQEVLYEKYLRMIFLFVLQHLAFNRTGMTATDFTVTVREIKTVSQNTQEIYADMKIKTFYLGAVKNLRIEFIA